MTDELALTTRVKNGDREAFGVLYDHYAEPIYRFVYYKVFSKELAEDLVSEVFMKAFQKIDSYDDRKGSFSSWLYRIARNAVIDYYRVKKSTVPIDDTFDLGFDERTPDALDAIATLGKISEYLKTLSARQREIITLRVWEGLSYREIADIIGGTEDSVKMAFSRSIRDIREKYGPLAVVLLCLLARTASLPFSDLS